MQTYVERQMVEACARNTPVLPTDNSQVVVITGPVRLAHKNPAALAELARNAVLGHSTKEIKKLGIGAPASGTMQFTSTLRQCGNLIRVSGAPNTFRRAPVTISVWRNVTTLAAGLPDSGSLICKFTVYPAASDAQVLVLFTNDNGGVGQITADTGVAVSYSTADNSGDTASEYAISAESINARDFVTRENV